MTTIPTPFLLNELLPEPSSGRLSLPEHPLRGHLTALAAFAAGIVPHRIVGNHADVNDACALIDDLLLLAAKVDRVVEAYGDYAAEHWHGIDKHLFKDQLSKALDGQALYSIESAAQDAADEVAESAAQHPGTARASAVGFGG